MRIVRENPELDVEDLAGLLELEFEETDHGDQLAIQINEAVNRRGE